MSMERTRTSTLVSVDPIWHEIRAEAEAMVRLEPEMAGLAFACILNEDRLEHAIAQRIVQRLEHTELPGQHIRQAFDDFLEDQPEIAEVMRVDLAAVYDRDPACARKIEPVLYFKGFQAIQTQRLGHWLWHQGRRDFALYLQSRSSIIYGVDIHPAVAMGRGVFIDHATGVVVGMTAVIEDDVSILQEVTLGGTGKERGDRHPKIRRGVLIGAGAKILGNIEVGACSRVAAGSVVLHEVPPGVTVAGVPARVVGRSGCVQPSRNMDQILAEQRREE